jgi:hypothetical protein
MIAKWMTVVVLSSLLWPARLQKEDDTMAWSATRRLAWSDFRGQPDDNSSDAALTSSSIEFGYNYDSRVGFTWHIKCLFDKNRSWGKVKNDYILAHEQGHFDITEIYARRLQKQFKEYHFNKEKAQKEVPALYQAIMKQQTETQQRYDDETNHSRVKDKQAAWLEKIKKELEEMKAYADYN